MPSCPAQVLGVHVDLPWDDTVLQPEVDSFRIVPQELVQYLHKHKRETLPASHVLSNLSPTHAMLLRPVRQGCLDILHEHVATFVTLNTRQSAIRAGAVGHAHACG